jgi:phosphate acetyltransferase
MEIIEKLHEKARSDIKTIVLPEFEDKRVLEAARIIQKKRIANPLVLTKDNISDSDRERYIVEFYQLRKPKGVDIETVNRMFEDPLYYAAMMTREGKADGFVAGAAHTTADVARAAIWCLGVDERTNIASSAFIMAVPDCNYGEKGTFVFADCGIIDEPNPRQLAGISLMSAELAEKVLNFVPRVALLSYSTRGSAEGKRIQKIREALELLKTMAPGLLADGEMQVDAAIVPEVSDIKAPDSLLKGRANVLIFPNLESGNIGYKLLQRLAGARAIGPLLLGLKKPCSDLSRGCSVEDVVDCVAVTAIRAQ